MVVSQDKMKFFLPFIVTTATTFPGLTLKHSGGQPQIVTGLSTGTSRAKEVNMYA